MRKFRGLTKEGKWIYGWYGEDKDGKAWIYHTITAFDTSRLDKFTEVIPKTVGQFTGLKDKKHTKEYPEGQEIYEGDRVSSGFWGGIVEFKKGAFKIIQGGYTDSSNFDVVEIIGNIHQNPELIEDKKDVVS